MEFGHLYLLNGEWEEASVDTGRFVSVFLSNDYLVGVYAIVSVTESKSSITGRK